MLSKNMESEKYNMQIKLTHVAIIVLAFLLLGGGTWAKTQLDNMNISIGDKDKDTPIIPPTHLAATLMFTLRQGIRGTPISSGASYVDICKGTNGYFNWLVGTESITVNSNPEYSALPYEEGTELVFHCSSDVDPSSATGGECYDSWYYVKLLDNEPVYKLDPSTMSKTPSGERVKYTSGTTNYWGIGNLAVTEKALGTTGVEMYVKYYATVLSSVTDGASWDDTFSEINANQTLPDDSEFLTFELVMDDANNAFGLPIYTIGIAGNIEVRRPVVIFSTSMTAIDAGALSYEGWKPIQDSTLYAERAFYHFIDPCVPTKGSSYGAWSVKIPIECASAAGSTEYVFRFWVIEGDTEDQIKQGSTTVGLPAIYGFITEIGPDAGHLDHLAYTTASGAGATWCCYTYITTAA